MNSTDPIQKFSKNRDRTSTRPWCSSATIINKDCQFRTRLCIHHTQNIYLKLHVVGIFDDVGRSAVLKAVAAGGVEREERLTTQSIAVVVLLAGERAVVVGNPEATNEKDAVRSRLAGGADPRSEKTGHQRTLSDRQLWREIVGRLGNGAAHFTAGRLRGKMIIIIRLLLSVIYIAEMYDLIFCAHKS